MAPMRNRRKKSSVDSERHFRRRMAERYGLWITSPEYHALCADVRNGRGRPLFRESNTRTHWLIAVGGVTVRVVYDKTVGALATALPPDTATRNSTPSAPTPGDSA
jgi:hypothetical protein